MSGGPIEFEAWPKIARLNRDITITEKIDGTNAAIVIKAAKDVDRIMIGARPDGKGGVEYDRVELFEPDASKLVAPVVLDGETFYVFAQSRSRFITPGKATDNYGFAGWVQTNAQALVETLGEGAHFGEWWGSGIQRGYGLKGGDKRFSLFNTHRWSNVDSFDIPGLAVVPIIYRGPFGQVAVDAALAKLRVGGSYASDNGAEPEGIVVFMHASRTMYKVTLKGDDAPKGPEGHARDEENK